MTALNRTTDAAAELLTTAEAKTHCRIDHSDDDTYIDTLVKVARQVAEDYTRRSFINQTWTMKLDRFPAVIELPMGPISSVTSISYIDTAGDSQVLSTSVYDVDASSEPGRIVQAYGQSWPSTRDVVNAVTVVYVAGYGDASSNVPEQIRQAVRLLVGHLYETREATIASSVAIQEVPLGVKALLNGYRLF